MSKTLSLTLVSAVVIVTAATFNIQGALASQGVEFIQVSVLSEHQANYGIDVNLGTTAAISMDIIQDKINDDAQAGGDIRQDDIVTWITSNNGSGVSGTGVGIGSNADGNGNGNSNGCGNGNGGGKGCENGNRGGNGNGNSNGCENGNRGGKGCGNGNGGGNGNGNGKIKVK